MRTAISYLDKVSSFTDEITVENVVKALGISDYDKLYELLFLICAGNTKASIEIIEDIYNQGKDMKLFIKQFIQFILDVCKYKIYKSYEYIQIPNTINLEEYNNIDYIELINILDKIIELNTAIKYEANPKILIESNLLLVIRKEVENK